MQEEETALLSIGAVLEWEDATSPLWPEGLHSEVAELYKEEEYQRYVVKFDPERSDLTAAYLYDIAAILNSLGSPPGKSEYGAGWRWYNSLAEAKAACEIHAATGAFPPSVEPELLDVEPQSPGAEGAA